MRCVCVWFVVVVVGGGGRTVIELHCPFDHLSIYGTTLVGFSLVGVVR